MRTAERETQYRLEYWATGEWPEWCIECGATVPRNETYCPFCGEFQSAWELACIVGIAGDD